MIKIENEEVFGWEAAIRGMRNPMNSWSGSDSIFCKKSDCVKCKMNDVCGSGQLDFDIGHNDNELMLKLSKAGTAHRKYMRMITVYVDITAPLYWWKEFDTYKVGTVANSCSTMHKIHAKEFKRSDFSTEHLINCVDQRWSARMDGIISALNVARAKYIRTNDKKYWWQMIQLLPNSYNQRRTVMLNYEVLVNIYNSRKNHKLDEWCDFCKWIESLPYSYIITNSKEEKINERK